MDEIIEQIRQLAVGHPELHSHLCYGPVSEDDLTHVEKELGLRLPRSFRAYLLGFAGSLILGYEMCGIPTEKSRIPAPPPDLGLDNTVDYSILSIVDTNRQMRKYYPHSEVYISSDGGDYSFFLATTKMSVDGECPVIMYGPGAPGVKVANSFLHFLELLARETSFVV